MISARLTWFFLNLICALSISAQATKVRFDVTPSKQAKLELDGKDLGLADGQKLTLGFNVRKGIESYEVKISCSGYQSMSYTIDPNSPRSQTIDCDLERDFNRIENPPSLVFDIEKVVSGIEYATEVGANTRWKYRYDEEVNLSTRMPKMQKALEEMGLKTLKGGTDDLFDVGNSKPKNPDIIIAGRIEDFSLSRTSENGYSGGYASTTSINWQIFDRQKKEIILKVTNSTTYQFETNLVSEQFYEAILNNFYSFLSETDDFKGAVEGLNEDDYTDLADSSDLDDEPTAEEIVAIPEVRLEKRESFSDLVELAMNASVTVLIDQDQSHGSGVVVSSNGYIVSNHHVTDGAKIIDVQFSNGMTLPADLITSSKDHDLSLIKVRASGLTALPIIKNPDNAREGDEVFVIGAPGDIELSQSVSKGIISAKRNIDGVKVFQTDTKISPGNSGSPLINNEGEIIGIINMKMIGEGVEGLSFAIDSRYLHSVLGLEYE
jgi:hypothetical protein